MNSLTVNRSVRFVVFPISLILFYLVGGWMLPVAVILFGWGMNLENTAKENQ